MKNILICLLSLFPILCSAQNIEVKYAVYSKARAKMVNKMKSRKENRSYMGMLSGLSVEREDSFRLTFKDFASSFIKMEPEEELSDDKGPKIVLVSPSYSEENCSVFKNLSDRSVIEQRNLLGRTYSIRHKLSDYKWQIKSDNKDIMGQKCYKAVLGDSVTAWFCPTIPIQDGPGTYYGLPGLILDLDDPQTTYKCSYINTKSSEKIGKPKLSKEVSEEEFERIRQRVLNRSK